MGIGGHILGEKKLRQLSERSGLDLDRAYRRNHEVEGRVVQDGQCRHYAINWETGEARELTPDHWSSCTQTPENRPQPEG